MQVSKAQVQIYADFDGDVDLYQRQSSPHQEVLGGTWSTIEDLRRRLFLVSTGIASPAFQAAVKADLAMSMTEDASGLLVSIVERDVAKSQGRQPL